MIAKQLITAAVFASALAVAAAQGLAGRINTDEEGGTYNDRFCPILADQLSRSDFSYSCEPSSGTAENIRRVMTDPSELGYGQLDVFASKLANADDAGALVPVRTDDVRQCLFAVTKRRDLQSFGDLSGRSTELNFHLPPQQSGSADTFAILQQIDPTGLGKASIVKHEASPDDAIRSALSEENGVAFFVDFPDPDAPRFALVRELGGHYVPIIDREILRQQIGGQKIYFAQETQVANADWLTTARKVDTACTPVVLFTGAPEKIADPEARKDHEDLIATIKALRTEALLPDESTIARVIARTKELSATSAERLMQASEKAREQARPYIDRAKEATDKAVEAAKPALEKAKEYGIRFYEKAREGLKELMGTKPEDGQPSGDEPAPDAPQEQPR